VLTKLGPGGVRMKKKNKFSSIFKAWRVREISGRQSGVQTDFMSCPLPGAKVNEKLSSK